MATREELLGWLAEATDNPDLDEEAVRILVADLVKLNSEDLPHGVEVWPAIEITEDSWVPDGEGISMFRGDETPLVAVISERYPRKYWDIPLGADDYRELVRLAVEARERSRGDVHLADVWGDENLVGLEVEVPLRQRNLRVGYEHVKFVRSELVEAAEAVNAGVADVIASAAKRLQGWGSDPLDLLVDRMREGTAYEKGLTLEELTSRLLARVPGFDAAGRVMTETEEIDIHIQNRSDDEIWRRESALLIAECKNWSAKCGKDEFVLFKSKLMNRTGRVSCGFLVSWNGFAETVTAEMLRGTEGNLLVVPMTGADLRAAVRDGDFPDRLKELHQRAVLL